MCKNARRFMSGLKPTRKLSRLQKPCQTLYPVHMKTLCAFAFCLVFAAAEGVAKQRHCTFRLHAQANPKDTDVFATSVRAGVSGKDVAIERIPRISENDVIAFYPYPAANGSYGALFQLDEHVRSLSTPRALNAGAICSSCSSMASQSRNSKSTNAFLMEESTSLPD
jgi:hypothetical protein